MKAWKLTIPTLLAGVLIAGCNQTPEAVAITTEGGRAQTFAHAGEIELSNPFIGIWGVENSYASTEWFVIFTADGQVAIDGPNFKASGVYASEGYVAVAQYDSRNGEYPNDPTLRETVFMISEDGGTIAFQATERTARPVTLVRLGIGATGPGNGPMQVPQQPGFQPGGDPNAIPPTTLVTLPPTRKNS
jgi:hypothetical protein